MFKIAQLNLLCFLCMVMFLSGGCTKKSVHQIRIDGSSTVFPITEAVAEEFQKQNKARVVIGISGTGGGFKKFCAGEVAVIQASRPIKTSEIKSCAQNKIEFIELPIAYDGIVIVVNPQNTWVNDISMMELKKLWEPEAQNRITKWNQIRAQWPDQKINLFAPGVDSGTYDYFTAEIVGKEHSSRGDITSSEDDNVLVQGVAMDKYALGFFGLAYFEENKEKVKALQVMGVTPSFETVAEGKYQPLSRPLFVYVNKTEVKKTAVLDFMKFYLNKGAILAKEVGYVPLTAREYELVKKRFDDQISGSIFTNTKVYQSTKVEHVLIGKVDGFAK